MQRASSLRSVLFVASWGSWYQRISVSKLLLLLSVVLSVVAGQSPSEFQSPPSYNLRSTAVSAAVSEIHERQVQELACNEECCLRFNQSVACGEEAAAEAAAAETSWVSAMPLALQLIMIIILILFSALFSGLTLGLMSLDKTGLEIVMEGDDEKDARAARIIYPVRKDGNLLLCTLLLGNVAVNALLSILLADMSSGLVGFLVSTILIVIFGEIAPQAACSRYALVVGSFAVPIVRVIIILIYVVAKPLAMILDCVLGRELATTYTTSEMLKLLQIHVTENVLDKDTATAMEGALRYKDKVVREVMTPLEHAFMLDVDEKLNFETIARIFKTGYSRIPIYEISKNNVTGLLFTKDLIFIDPNDETPVRSFIEIFGRTLHTVWPDDKLDVVLRDLKQGRSHMALVRDVNNEDETQDPFYEIKGIITLEDIIEEILGQEIVDETDAFVDVTDTHVKVDRAETFEWARLRLLNSSIVDEKLSYDEAKAVTAHLKTNYFRAVAALSDNQLHKMVSDAPVTLRPTAVRELGEDIPKDLLYKKGVETDNCTLILSGKVTVLAGVDGFRSDVSSLAVLGASALSDPTFKPDFTAYVSAGPLRCIHFSRANYTKALEATAIERRTGVEIPNGDSNSEHKKSMESINADDAKSVHSEASKLSLADIGRGRDKNFMAALRVGKNRRSARRPASSKSPMRNSSSQRSNRPNSVSFGQSVSLADDSQNDLDVDSLAEGKN